MEKAIDIPMMDIYDLIVNENNKNMSTPARPTSIWDDSSVTPGWKQSALEEMDEYCSWRNVQLDAVSKVVNVLWQRTPLKKKPQFFPNDNHLRKGPLSSIVALSECVESPVVSTPRMAKSDGAAESYKDPLKDVTEALFPTDVSHSWKSEKEAVNEEIRTSTPPIEQREEADSVILSDATNRVDFAESIVAKVESPTKTVKSVHCPTRPRNSPLKKIRGIFSILVANVPSGHYNAVIDQIKKAIECLARSKYDPNYSVAMQVGSFSGGSIVMKFKRWIDLHLACAIGPQVYEGRTLPIKPQVVQDHFPNVDRQLMEKETWMKKVKRSPEKEGRYYMVWSEKMDLGKVAELVKKTTGRSLAFKKPVTISENQKGFFMRAAKTADLVNIMLRLDGTQSHRSGAVLRVRPWLHYDDFFKSIRSHVAILKKA